MSSLPLAKVVLLGDMAVGKTSIVLQIYKGKFDPASTPTVGVSYVTKIVESKKGPIELHIWDTAGQEAFRSVIPSYLRGSNAALIVCAIDDSSSIDHLQNWVDFVREHNDTCENIYIILNKIDLKTSEVEVEKVQVWAEERGLPLFETSAMQAGTLTPLMQRLSGDLCNLATMVEESSKALVLTKKQRGCC